MNKPTEKDYRNIIEGICEQINSATTDEDKQKLKDLMDEFSKSYVKQLNADNPNKGSK